MMRKSVGSESRPHILISATDQLRLTDMAMTALNRAPEVAEELLSEIERATVVPAHAVPANVVQMGSTVEFTTEAGVNRRVTLVFPGQADIAAARISVVTPIGAALIGLSEGQSIAWSTRDGRERCLTVLAVEPAAPHNDAPWGSGLAPAHG
jgi:regulator of nucleoside diphosphate kinase